MSETVRFERSHDILIHAPAGDILDYVSNPNSWPEWIAASQHIESPDRPLDVGETFREHWYTRRGEVILDWKVTERRHPTLWVAKADTGFIGKIIARYDVDETEDGCHYTRTIINPARPKMPTEQMIRAHDDEAEVSLRNIKNNVEKRRS
ncbi:MAG: SRPBCC family protein [Deltaproteobacteria bacterium]|nr:SRPBCC family protein [Deltaproteobacteria bacterium]